MVNLVFYGEGKEGRLRELRTGIARYLPDDWNCNLVTTLKDTVEKVKCQKVKFYYPYDDSVFDRNLSATELEDIEKWLRFPLRVIKQYDRYVREIMDKKKDKEILNFIGKFVFFWRKFFEENKIDVLIGGYPSSVPYTTAEVIAQRMGIKVLKYVLDFMQKGFVMCNKNYDVIEWNHENYDESEIDAVYNKVKDEFISRKKPLQSSTIDAFKWNLSTANPKVLFLKAKQLLQIIEYNKKHKHELYLETVSWQTKEYIKSVLRAKIIPMYYQEVKKDDKYFFYPYHYIMDAQMLYREPYIEQYNLAENIAKCIPYNTYLYTRAHPGYFGSDLPYDFVKKVVKIPNIKLIPTNIMPYEIIKNAIIIFTINSTTGYEAILLNKPVITFGHELYSRKGVTITVKDFNELPDIIFKVISEPEYGIELDKRKEFIYKIKKNSIYIEGGKKPTREYYAIWKSTENDYKNMANLLVNSYEHYNKTM